MSKCYMYVVDRDFGFAPNPFHACCTLATCKPLIRSRAELGDWVVGMGGRRLQATGRCVYAMRVTDTLSFDEYWASPLYRDKKPVRNGSFKMLVGDNIYHRHPDTGAWVQADSHHSNPDGTCNPHNLANDTNADRVLISTHFFYFGRSAPEVPTAILNALAYTNGRNYRVFHEDSFDNLIAWLDGVHGASLNLVLADPFDFEGSAKRYSIEGNRIR